MGKKEKSEEMEVEGGSLKAREFEGGSPKAREFEGGSLKERELKPNEDKDLFEKRQNSVDLPVSFFEGRMVSVLEIKAYTISFQLHWQLHVWYTYPFSVPL